MFPTLNSDLVSRLEDLEIEINFYFPNDYFDISKKLDDINSPLKFRGYYNTLRIYQIEEFKEDEFCLMNDKDDWLYDENKLKIQVTNEFGIIPKSLLFYQTKIDRNAAQLTRLISDYFVKQEIEFFLVGYSSIDESEDRAIFVNKI